jgi:hypothetical protein
VPSAMNEQVQMQLPRQGIHPGSVACDPLLPTPHDEC